MGNDVPRRMRRFQRQGIGLPGEEKGFDVDEIPLDSVSDEPVERGSGAIAKALALDEVERFKEEHKRLPKKEEYDQIAESIFLQLKDKDQGKKAIERLERKRGRPVEKGKEAQVVSEGGKETKGKIDRKRERALRLGRPVPGQPAGKEETVSSGMPVEGGVSSVENELKGLSVEDLFSDEKKQGRKKEGLEELEGGFSLEGMDIMDEGKGGQEKCPRCGKPAEQVVFCLECGTAFCEKCAKSIEIAGNAKNIACPGCGKKIKK